ncbi:MAG: alpha/beta fold hydrolase [Pseudomonadota bacterium]
MHQRVRLSPWRWLVAILALAAIGWALWGLRAGTAPLEIERFEVGQTPATLYRLPGAAPAPAVVVAHGFAGSRQLMEPFSVTLARAGYLVVAFDFEGHGRNPTRMGDVRDLEGVRDALIAETERVAAVARTLEGADGRVALLGHSMATAVIVPAAVDNPEIAATVAVSMSTEAITPTEPPNLLVIVGALEEFPRDQGLTAEALEAVALATGGEAVEGQTYRLAPDNARRAVFSDGVEHVGVLYSRESVTEALSWLDMVFKRPSSAPYLDVRGPEILVLLGGIVALGWPLAALLPRLAVPAPRTRARWRRFLPRALLPAVATPLLLWPIDVRFLPVLVADYLAMHFALYGLITALILWYDGTLANRPRAPLLAVLGAGAAMALWTTGVLGLALDAWVASFWPHTGRAALIAVLFLGTLAYLLTDEWLTRSPEAPRGAYAATKLAMLVSLVLAIVLNVDRLFFLAIIMPVVVLFFLLYGLFSAWAYRATGHPGVGGVANALAFAWALGVTFPLIGA